MAPVKFGSIQLNDSGFKNTKGIANTKESHPRTLYRFVAGLDVRLHCNNTKESHPRTLYRFNKWLPGDHSRRTRR